MSWQNDLAKAMARLERVTHNVSLEERERSVAKTNWRRVKFHRDLNSAARLSTGLVNARLDRFAPSGETCDCQFDACSGFTVKTPAGHVLCPIRISIQIIRLHLNGYATPFNNNLVEQLVMISKRRIT